jgi:hypothetical protein
MEHTTSDPHVELGETRQDTDTAMGSLLGFLLLRTPLAGDNTLRNIATGVTADPTVNADTAKAVGYSISHSMISC